MRRLKPPARRTGKAAAAAAPKRRARPAGQGAEASARVRLALGRVVVCGIVFVLLVTLKLIVPGNLAAFRGTLGQWLVRDADFAEAFSAVGRAVSGTGEVAEALDNAYIAVFGRQEADAAEVSAAAENVPDDAPPPARTEALGFACAAPLDGVLVSPYGWRTHPQSGAETFHYGVDLAADEGTPIACFADGTVGVVGESVTLGKYLTVQHADGFSTLYAHCSRILAASGEDVTMGQTIAEVGQTGNATGPHLHFELLSGEGHLDPTAYLSFPTED